MHPNHLDLKVLVAIWATNGEDTPAWIHSRLEEWLTPSSPNASSPDAPSVEEVRNAISTFKGSPIEPFVCSKASLQVAVPFATAVLSRSNLVRIVSDASFSEKGGLLLAKTAEGLKCHHIQRFPHAKPKGFDSSKSFLFPKLARQSLLQPREPASVEVTDSGVVLKVPLPNTPRHQPSWRWSLVGPKAKEASFRAMLRDNVVFSVRESESMIKFAQASAQRMKLQLIYDQRDVLTVELDELNDSAPVALRSSFGMTDLFSVYRDLDEDKISNWAGAESIGFFELDPSFGLKDPLSAEEKRQIAASFIVPRAWVDKN